MPKKITLFSKQVVMMVMILALLMPMTPNSGFIQDVGVQASTAPTVNIGDYIQFGKYYGEPILWRVINQDKDGDPVLLSDRILTIKAFDSKGSYHSDSKRRSSGSGYYSDSNIRQWLNSGDEAIKWIQNEPFAENISNGLNPYNKEKGFLAEGNFSSTDRKLIKPIEHQVLLTKIDEKMKDGGTDNHLYESSITTAVQNYDTTAFYQKVTDDVFLLSVKQLKDWIYDNRKILGTDYHLAKPTIAAVKNSSSKSSSLNSNYNWYYWLNTPVAEYSNYVRRVSNDGKIYDYPAFSFDGGIRPALQLNLASVTFQVDGAGTAEKPFVIEGSETPAPDTQPPTTPSELAASNVAPSSLTITWSASTDNIGVTAYEVYRGTTLIGTITGINGDTPARTFNVTGLLAGTAYSFSVKAKDAAGNVSATSTAISVTTTAQDKQAPTAPTGLNATNVATTSFTLNWTASTDNIGVTAYEIYQGATQIATVKADAGVVPTTYNVTDLSASTTYSFNVKAKDAAGNGTEARTPLTVTTSEAIKEKIGSAPTDISLSGNQVVEFNWVGYQIGSFTATDADADDTFTYAFVNGEGSEDNADFTIDGNTLEASSIFEYKEDERFYIRVQVTDSGDNTFEKPFEIEVTQGNVRLNALNDVATIYLDRKLFDNSAAATPAKTLKDFVKISRDANAESPTYEALGANDTVKISGPTLIVNFENQITSEFNRIKVEAEAMKDLLNYKSAEMLTTPLVTDKTGPAVSKVLMSRNKKSLELRFNEKVLMTSTAASLKAALSIDRGGTGVYSPLGSKDKVSIINEYKIGKDIIYKLNRRVMQVTLANRLTTLDNRIKINASALKDFAGNESQELITPEIEDVTGPELSSVKLSANNKTITVQLNEEAAFASGTTAAQKLQNLRDKIQLSTDGTTFNSLSTGDAVSLVTGNLVVTFANPLIGANNKLQIGPNALKDMFDNFNGQLTTASIAADSTPPACTKLLDSACDSVKLPQLNENKRLTITFKERVFGAPTTKQAVQIQVGSEAYKALGSKDTVSASGRTLVINFSKALAKNTSYKIKLAAGAIKDVTGNQSLEIETVAFEVDTEGPKLR